MTDQYMEIETGLLYPGKHQPRTVFSKESIADLARSIEATSGVVQPVIVRRYSDNHNPEDGYEIIAGERRWRAYKLLERPTIPCVLREISDEDAAVFALVENVDREDLSITEVAEAVFRLNKEFRWSQDKIAERVGKTRDQISRLCGIVKLPKSIKRLLDQKRIEMGHVKIILAKRFTPEDQEHLIRQTVERGWTVRDLTAAARTHVSPKKGEGSADIGRLVEELQMRLNCRAELEQRPLGQWRLKLHLTAPQVLSGAFEELAQILDQTPGGEAPVVVEMSGPLKAFDFLGSI